MPILSLASIVNLKSLTETPPLTYQALSGDLRFPRFSTAYRLSRLQTLRCCGCLHPPVLSTLKTV